MWNKRLASVVAAGMLASMYLGFIPQQAAAAPVIANMPHKADGRRITGNQPVPKTMPQDVVTNSKHTPPAQTASKTATPKPATPPAQTASKTATPKPATPPAQTASKTATPKPSTPPAQTAPKTTTPKPATPPAQTAPKTVTPKPATPPAQTAPKTATPKPATPPAQTASKTATPKPATPPAQTAPKTVTPKPVTPPKPATPPAQTAPKTTAPKPAVKAPAALPTKPPGWRAQQPKTGADVTARQKSKAAKENKKEEEKSVYKVGDKGWKIKQAQQYLLKLGFDPDETDGRFTKSTRKAIRKFQKKYKLKETGNLDNATYQELKFQAEAKEYGGSVASTKILKTAAQYKGVPYVFGGTTPRGFDCSGYVQFVFAKHGIRLTRTADTQAREGKFVSRKALKPGDLVFFTTYEPGASHVGIYAGNNQFWNATSSRGIMLSNLNDSYWGPRYYTARRILTGK